MINLLPNETKKQIKAARINGIIVKYLLVSIIAIIILGGGLCCDLLFNFSK